ncbi:MAG: hypothetical protein C4533_05100 [Candidatus Omnitrophota bacterium]|jgi:hypothetical protein|nr:MAG: hypothetical protein C4533_05100 [Candidatus Omnitrophota bacterium]
MEKLNNYLDSLVKGRFFGSIKINFEDGVPVLIKEEKAVDVAPFKEEIRRIRRKDSFNAE